MQIHKRGFDSGRWGPYHARAMGNLLRDRCTAAELASVEQVIEITENIGSFKHLSEIVEADLAALAAEKTPSGWRDSEVHGELQFGYVTAAQGVPTVSGSASVAVDAVCQRCLEPFSLKIEIEPRLMLIKAEDEADAFDEFEVWELEQDVLRPLDIVEELLIMAMPFSATHDNIADCKAFSSDDEPARKMTRPFAALASQMQQIEKNSDD